MSNSEAESAKILREDGEWFSCSEYFWLSSCRSDSEVSKKVYFTTKKPTIYTKSLEIYLKSCYYLDEHCKKLKFPESV